MRFICEIKHPFPYQGHIKKCGQQFESFQDLVDHINNKRGEVIVKTVPEKHATSVQLRDEY